MKSMHGIRGHNHLAAAPVKVTKKAATEKAVKKAPKKKAAKKAVKK